MRARRRVAAVLLFVLLCPLSIVGLEESEAAGTVSDIIINEFLPAPASDWDGSSGYDSADDEWIELYNPTDTPIDVGGCFLDDEAGGSAPGQIPAGTVIPAGGFLVLYGSDVPGPLGFNNADDEARLLASDGTTEIDFRSYGTVGSDNSYGRERDGDTSWQIFESPTPGARNRDDPPAVQSLANTPLNPTSLEPVTITAFVSDDYFLAYVNLSFSTDGQIYVSVEMLDDGVSPDTVAGDGNFTFRIPAQADGTIVHYYVNATDDAGQYTALPEGTPYLYAHSDAQPDIVLNEYLEVGSDSEQEWLELFNNGTTLFCIDGWTLGDASIDGNYTFPSHTCINASGFLLASGSTTEINLNNGGDSIFLYDESGTLIGSHTYTKTLGGISWGRYPDAYGLWSWLDHPTPKAPNSVTLNEPPFILSFEHFPDIPTSEENVSVTARVADDFDAIDMVNLRYTTDGVTFIDAEMEGNDTFAAQIPPFPAGTTVSYSIQAIDDSGNTSFSDFVNYTVDDILPHLRINEFLAYPDYDWDGDGTFDARGDEWIELYNPTSQSVNLTGYYLEDEISEWQIPGGTLPPGGFSLFFGSDWGGGMTFNNGGDTVRFIDPNGTVIDRRSYSSASKNESIGRVWDGATSWTEFTIPTPGNRNRDLPPAISGAGHTPQNPQASQQVLVSAAVSDDYFGILATLHYSVDGGAEASMLMDCSVTCLASLPAQSIGATVEYHIIVADDRGQTARYPPDSNISYTQSNSEPKVIISEYLAYPKGVDWNGDGTPGSGDEWIELCNIGNHAAAVGGWTLDDIDAGGSQPYIFSPGSVILSGKCQLYFESETGIKLNNDGDELRLVNETSKVVDSTSYISGEFDISLGRNPTNASDWLSYGFPSPGDENDPAQAANGSEATVRLESVFYRATSEFEYICIENPSAEAVDISFWRLSDLEGTVIFPDGSWLAPGGKSCIANDATIYLQITGELPDYSFLDNPGVVPIGRGDWPKLSNSGDTLLLKGPSGQVMDALIYGDVEYSGSGWTGAPASGVYKGEILARKASEDTDTASDWADLRTFALGQSSFLLQSFQTDGNITAFTSPSSSCETVLSVISNATESIAMAVYQLTHPDIVRELINASGRGVSVSLLVEGSPVGWSMSNVPKSSYKYDLYESYLQKYYLNQLFENGTDIRFMVSNDTLGSRYNYLHAKYLIADNSSVLLASENWKPSGMPPEGEMGNRGWGVVIDDAEVAGYFASVFWHDFSAVDYDIVRFKPENKKYGAAPYYFAPDNASEYYSWESDKSFDSVSFSGPATVTPVLAPDTSLASDAIIGLMEGARASIYMELLDTDLDWNWRGANYTNLYLEAGLEAARERGVAVKLLLDSRYIDPEDFTSVDNYDVFRTINDYAERHNITHLLEARLVNLERLYFSKIHNKGMIVDGEAVLVSSINWNPNSVAKNRETAVIIESTDVAGYFTEVFLWDWNEPPVASAGAWVEDGTFGQIEIHAGEMLHLDALNSTDSDAWPLEYFWNFGDGENGTGATLEHVFHTPGVYNVRLNVSDGQYYDFDTVRVVVLEARPQGARLSLPVSGVAVGLVVVILAQLGVAGWLGRRLWK